MENINSIIRKEGAKRGLLFGAILLVVNILLIYCTAYWVKAPVPYFIMAFVFTYVIQISLTLYLTSNLRKKVGGYWDLKQAATGIFFILFITYLLSSGGRWLYFKAIDPATVEKADVEVVGIRQNAMQMMNRPQKDIDKTITEMKASITEGKNITVGRSFQDVTVSIILLFALSIILGALFKREHPSYTTKA